MVEIGLNNLGGPGNIMNFPREFFSFPIVFCYNAPIMAPIRHNSTGMSVCVILCFSWVEVDCYWKSGTCLQYIWYLNSFSSMSSFQFPVSLFLSSSLQANKTEFWESTIFGMNKNLIIYCRSVSLLLSLHWSTNNECQRLHHMFWQNSSRFHEAQKFPWSTLLWWLSLFFCVLNLQMLVEKKNCTLT